MPIKVYAVEKNVNAVITLRNRVEMESWYGFLLSIFRHKDIYLLLIGIMLLLLPRICGNGTLPN